MTKLEVYIDFESISAPFNWKVGIKTDFPYAYSVGLYAGKTFKTKTFIFNFNKQDSEDIERIIRHQLLTDVRKLSGKKDMVINAQTIRFVSFSPILEKKILSNVYKGIEVYDISLGKSISLSNATKSFDKTPVVYFEKLKAWVDKNMDPVFVSKRGMKHDGALAALAGHILLVDATNQTSKYYSNPIDIRTLVKEIAVYSNDDVVRMKYIKEDVALYLKTSEKVEKALKKANTARKKLKSLEVVKAFLKENNEVKDIDALLKLLETEIEKNKELIEELKTK